MNYVKQSSRDDFIKMFFSAKCSCWYQKAGLDKVNRLGVNRHVTYSWCENPINNLKLNKFELIYFMMT